MKFTKFLYQFPPTTDSLYNREIGLQVLILAHFIFNIIKRNYIIITTKGQELLF